MNTDQLKQLVVTHRFVSSAERVYDSWLDPASAAKWFFATPHGQITQCEIDARVGGKFLLVDRREGVDVHHIGEYLELERPRRIVFTLSVPTFSSDTGTVEVDIVATGSGCELTLKQAVRPQLADKVQTGWEMIFGNLGKDLGE